MHQLFSVTGTELIVFRLNPFHNIIHLLLGGLLLWASIRGTRARRAAGFAAGVALASLAAIGFWMAANPEANRLAANTADNVLHLAVVPIAAITALVDRKFGQTASR
jgi:ABC-type nitrate/sulfonate/bicarbonate transport system permease component